MGQKLKGQSPAQYDTKGLNKCTLKRKRPNRSPNIQTTKRPETQGPLIQYLSARWGKGDTTPPRV